MDEPIAQFDALAMEIIRDSVWRMYGWRWPVEMGLKQGGSALLEYLIEKHANDYKCEMSNG